MSRGLYIDGPENIGFLEYVGPQLRENQVRVQATFAAIKHGTEFHLFSGHSPFQTRRFDGESRLFVDKDADSTEDVVRRFAGNMVVGEVIEVGTAVTKVSAGDYVYGYGPACETVILSEKDAHPLTKPMTAQDAVCLDPAFYAYAAVRDANVCLGDTVVVFGLGAIGLLLVQMLRLGGANVIAVDLIEKRRALAQSFGAMQVLDPAACDVALEVRKTFGQGADIAIEASGSYRALHSAMRSVGKCARVVTLGYYNGKDTQLELGAEWFHNRLELICSMPVWGNPSREHPVWTETRMIATVREMFLHKQLTSCGIIDPIVPFDGSAEAFLSIYKNPAQAIKMGIQF